MSREFNEEECPLNCECSGCKFDVILYNGNHECSILLMSRNSKDIKLILKDIRDLLEKAIERLAG